MSVTVSIMIAFALASLVIGTGWVIYTKTTSNENIEKSVKTTQWALFFVLVAGVVFVTFYFS